MLTVALKATTAQNTATTIDVLANDTGSGLKLNSTDSWSLRGGRVSINNNLISYAPKQGFTGVDNLWYTFEDSQGRVNSAQVNITVQAGSTFPVARSDNYTTALNTGKVLDILANDTANSWFVIDTLYEYTAKGGKSYKTPEGKVWYIPKTGFTGEDNFWYVMVDAQGQKNSAQVKINVTGGSGDFAVANSDYYTTASNTGKVLDILSNDTGGSWRAIDTLFEYTAKGGKSYKTPEGKVWYVPKTGFIGEDDFWYVMIDSEGRKRSAQVKINVTP